MTSEVPWIHHTPREKKLKKKSTLRNCSYKWQQGMYLPGIWLIKWTKKQQINQERVVCLQEGTMEIDFIYVKDRLYLTQAAKHAAQDSQQKAMCSHSRWWSTSAKKKHFEEVLIDIAAGLHTMPVWFIKEFGWVRGNNDTYCNKKYCARDMRM